MYLCDITELYQPNTPTLKKHPCCECLSALHPLLAGNIRVFFSFITCRHANPYLSKIFFFIVITKDLMIIVVVIMTINAMGHSEWLVSIDDKSKPINKKCHSIENGYWNIRKKGAKRWWIIECRSTKCMIIEPICV